MTIARICEVVAARYHLTMKQLRSPKSCRSVAWPRQIAMYLARRHLHHSYPRIGRFFEMDHSTVVHAVRRVELRMAGDQEVWDEVVALHMVLDTMPSPRPPAARQLRDRFVDELVAGGVRRA